MGKQKAGRARFLLFRPNRSGFAPRDSQAGRAQAEEREDAGFRNIDAAAHDQLVGEAERAGQSRPGTERLTQTILPVAMAVAVAEIRRRASRSAGQVAV